MRYAYTVVPGHEAETAGVSPADGDERVDHTLGLRYEVVRYFEAESAEAALEAAMEYLNVEVCVESVRRLLSLRTNDQKTGD